jgi:ring-1,2-phenylacetyl-CoA epoxidase subunit PaaC
MTSKEALFQYSLRIGDNALVLAQRISEWSGHAPILEEDIAMSNMSLDLIGQARGFLTYAALVEGKGRTEDELAFTRDARELKNRCLLEQPNGDFAVSMMRSFLFSAIAYLQFRQLVNSKDETISGLSEKSLKEITYHLRHSSQWIIRLGDGTEESHKRAQAAVNELWFFTDELFEMNEVDDLLIRDGIACDLKKIKPEWDKLVDEVFEKAKLVRPVAGGYQSSGGISGSHTEHLGFLLAEMQFVPRAYPDSKW